MVWPPHHGPRRCAGREQQLLITRAPGGPRGGSDVTAAPSPPAAGQQLQRGDLPETLNYSWGPVPRTLPSSFGPLSSARRVGSNLQKETGSDVLKAPLGGGPGFESRGSHLQTNLRQLLPLLGPSLLLLKLGPNSAASELHLGSSSTTTSCAAPATASSKVGSSL